MVVEKKDVVAATQFTGADGQPRTHWLRVGKYYKTETSEFIRLDSIPTNKSWDSTLRLFAEKPKQDNGNTGNANNWDNNDGLPW